MAKQFGPKDESLGSADLFGDDSEDDFWLNEVIEGENDPEVLELVASAMSKAKDHNQVPEGKPKEDSQSYTECEKSKYPLLFLPEFDSDEDTFQARQGGYVLTPSNWNAHGTPITTWNLSPCSEISNNNLRWTRVQSRRKRINFPGARTSL